jgi:hypothetical protein
MTQFQRRFRHSIRSYRHKTQTSWICNKPRVRSETKPLDLFYTVACGGMRLSPLVTSATNGPIVPAPDYRWIWSIFGGMRIGRGNRSSRRKPVLVPLCPPQIPHDLTRDRTQAAAVGSRRLTAWATARPATKLKTEDAILCCMVIAIAHHRGR